MYLRRTVDELLDTFLPQAPAIALDGAKGVGKTGTMLLLLAFPLMLLGSPDSFGLVVAEWAGWVLAIAGAFAYWAAGILYLKGTVELAHERGDRDAS